jgi:hypothetical protein
VTVLSYAELTGSTHVVAVGVVALQDANV